ncbi:T9SS type A sorting domain-containing protein [Flavobacterium sp.]|uniref:T9SS type A sorting domain-containing protein n=1 Tax=Flavobacterium sp. TaxID=239 RepID=UPI00261C7B43|nr:T9SS type A sorting domain-containing protein [Flavobacterium sp.]
MKLKLHVEKFAMAAAILGLSLTDYNATAQTNITVDAEDAWIGGMNVYNLDGTYAFYNEWGLADVKTEINVAENTISLFPNYNTYNTADPYWTNPDGSGNKITEGLTMIINDALVGEDVTFSGTVVSNTLINAYEAKAFVKVLDGNWQTIAEDIVILSEPGNFTLELNTSEYPAAVHFQYGFMVTGVNANPADMEANGYVVVTEGEPQVSEPETVTVTLAPNTTQTINAYANWFQLDGTTYENGNVWSLEELKTEIDSENNTFILYPNFNTYGDGTDPYWANGEIGNKIFEGNTYVEDNSLVGQNVVFSGYCVSNTLAEGYDGVAFVKVMTADYQLLNFTPTPLVAGESFNINVDVADFPTAAFVQYGYAVTGLNANPDQMEALGNAVVSAEALSVDKVVKNAAVIYPNPTSGTLNIAVEGTVQNVAIYNMMGQKVMQTSGATIDVSALNSGMYVISTTVNGNTSSARFIKK